MRKLNLLFSLAIKVEEREHGVEQVDGAKDDAQGAHRETDLFLLCHGLVLVLVLVARPVVKTRAAHGDEHERAHEVHQQLLKLEAFV